MLIIQDQYRAILQYSSSRGGPGSSRPGVYPSGGANSDNITDWYCSKCLVFNFKRRENCFKCYASREESERGGDGWDEVSNVRTKSKKLDEKKKQNWFADYDLHIILTAINLPQKSFSVTWMC